MLALLAASLVLPGEGVLARRLRTPSLKIRLFSRIKPKRGNAKNLPGKISRSQSAPVTGKIANEKESDLNYRRVNKRGKLTQQEIDALIRHYSRRYQLDHRFVKAVVKVESNFNPRCKSTAGAMGLMQLMPGTARELGVRDPWNPEESIAGGTRYLAKMRDRFKDMQLVLAAYNAGPGNVTRYDGIPPFAETKRYIGKVLKAYRQYRFE